MPRHTIRAEVARLAAEVAALRAAVQGLQRRQAGLDAGRAKAIAQAKRRAAHQAELVMAAAEIDARQGRPRRGRAGRIARRLHGQISERQVRRILDRLSSVSGSSSSNAGASTDREQAA